MNLRELRIWHWRQFVEAKEARDYCEVRRADMTSAFARRANFEAQRNFERLMALHVLAVEALDPLVPGSTAHADTVTAGFFV